MRLDKLKQNKIQNLISESVRRALTEATDFILYGQHFHFEGPNSDKQAKAMMKKLIRQHKIENGEKVPEEPKKRKKKKTEAMTDSQASPKGLAQNVKKMVTDVALKSIKGFIDHSKRQFGANATETLLDIFKNEAGGRNLFTIYNSIYNNIIVTISEIESWGKKDEYAVYERARKLGRLLENMADVLEEMGEVYTRLVQKRTISRTFGNEANVIMGNGHSLGVRSLVFAKGNIALAKLTGTLINIANKLAMIADNGRDPLDYDIDNLRESKLERIIDESVRRVLKEDFEQDYNTARQNYNRPLWGFEMKNQEGEWQYGDIEYDPNTQTMSCMGVTIDVDPSLSVDQNLEGLYEELMNNGFSDGDD